MCYIQSETIHICSLFCPIVLFLSKRWTGFGKRRSERLSVSLGNNKTSIYVSRIAALVRHPRNSRTDALQLAGARVTTLCRLCLRKYFWHCAFGKFICWTWFFLRFDDKIWWSIISPKSVAYHNQDIKVYCPNHSAQSLWTPILIWLKLFSAPPLWASQLAKPFFTKGTPFHLFCLSTELALGRLSLWSLQKVANDLTGEWGVLIGSGRPDFHLHYSTTRQPPAQKMAAQSWKSWVG